MILFDRELATLLTLEAHNQRVCSKEDAINGTNIRAYQYNVAKSKLSPPSPRLLISQGLALMMNRSSRFRPPRRNSPLPHRRKLPLRLDRPSILRQQTEIRTMGTSKLRLRSNRLVISRDRARDHAYSSDRYRPRFGALRLLPACEVERCR
jgi:hypothetical protein